MRTGSTPAKPRTILCIWAVSGMARGVRRRLLRSGKRGRRRIVLSGPSLPPAISMSGAQRCRRRARRTSKSAGRLAQLPHDRPKACGQVDSRSAPDHFPTGPTATSTQISADKNPPTTSPPKSRALNERIRAGLDGHQHTVAAATADGAGAKRGDAEVRVRTRVGGARSDGRANRPTLMTPDVKHEEGGRCREAPAAWSRRALLTRPSSASPVCRAAELCR